MDLGIIFYAGAGAIYDYILAHTLFCLIPAFFIAGAMAALVPKERFLQYLGKDSPKIIAYPLAVVSGLLLAVCSCTVLPLFAGIRKSGAGIGPAIAFLYTAPATNIIAVLYTGSLIGWDFAFARIFFSVIFAISIGLALNYFFKDEESAKISGEFGKKVKSTDKNENKRLLYLFATLLSILLVGTRISEDWLRYGLEVLLITIVLFISNKYFSKEERSAWMFETYNFGKTIFPLLLIGVFLSGVIRVLMPETLVSQYVGGNDPFSIALPVIFGIFVYFPTLVEVPMAKTFLDLGMSRGGLLAYLLSDPVVSLSSILVIRKLIGNKRTLFYVSAIFVLSVLAGYIFGNMK
jgi:uncharacterized protein